MNTIIQPTHAASATRLPEADHGFRQPNYDCREQGDSVRLTVYVPGVEAAGVLIESRGSDLIVTARKKRFVRVNWESLHLEAAQKDYLLRLRLGTGFSYPEMQAEIRNGILTITLPKRAPFRYGRATAGPPVRRPRLRLSAAA